MFSKRYYPDEQCRSEAQRQFVPSNGQAGYFRVYPEQIKIHPRISVLKKPKRPATCSPLSSKASEETLQQWVSVLKNLRETRSASSHGSTKRVHFPQKKDLCMVYPIGYRYPNNTGLSLYSDGRGPSRNYSDLSIGRSNDWEVVGKNVFDNNNGDNDGFNSSSNCVRGDDILKVCDDVYTNDIIHRQLRHSQFGAIGRLPRSLSEDDRAKKILIADDYQPFGKRMMTKGYDIFIPHMNEKSSPRTIRLEGKGLNSADHGSAEVLQELPKNKPEQKPIKNMPITHKYKTPKSDNGKTHLDIHNFRLRYTKRSFHSDSSLSRRKPLPLKTPSFDVLKASIVPHHAF